MNDPKGEVTMPSNSPTQKSILLFIPGAWHLPTCYTPLITLLSTQHNFSCDTVTLPTTSGSASANFASDLSAARAAITAHVTRGRDVVLIAHSYGGMVASSAIKGFTPSSPPPPSTPRPSSHEEQRQTGHVTGLILASGFTLTGLTFLDHTFNIPPPCWTPNRSTGFADLTVPPGPLFYNDLPANEAAQWTAQLRPQSLAALDSGADVAYAGWRDVAWRVYVGAADDAALPVAVQRVAVGVARGMGSSVWHVEVGSGHSVFLGRVAECAAVIVAAVGGFAEWEGVVSGMERRGVGREVGVGFGKGVRSWVRVGGPLALGWVVGRGLLLWEAWRGWLGRRVG